LDRFNKHNCIPLNCLFPLPQPGPTGPTGPTGPAGTGAGPTGPTGPTGGGAIVAFSSGLTPANMTVMGPGLIGIPSFIGFGTAISGLNVLGDDINLLGLVKEAFTVPRVGILDSIFANYTATGFTVPSTATVRAQLYINRAVNKNTNIFNPFGPLVTLVPDIVGIGAFLNADGNATGINLQVNPGDRLLMVFSLLGGTGSVASLLTGNASAGISIL